MKNLKWKEVTLTRIENMSNEELLEETLGLAGGDDYDGYFTDLGQFEYDTLYNELQKRLKICGFLGV